MPADCRAGGPQQAPPMLPEGAAQRIAASKPSTQRAASACLLQLSIHMPERVLACMVLPCELAWRLLSMRRALRAWWRHMAGAAYRAPSQSISPLRPACLAASLQAAHGTPSACVAAHSSRLNGAQDSSASESPARSVLSSSHWPHHGSKVCLSLILSLSVVR